jgi:hypothetical protein
MKIGNGNWRRYYYLWLCICLSFSTNAISDELSPRHAPPDLAVVQEWSISGSTAKIVIGRIERFRTSIAVHVSIIDIPVSQSGDRTNQLTRVSHIPFEKSALTASLDKLLATGVAAPADFEAGYRQWKGQHGGIFTVSVAQAIGLGQAA